MSIMSSRLSEQIRKRKNKSENMEKLYDEKADGDYPSLSEYELGILKAKEDFIRIIDELEKEEKSIWISSEKLKQKIGEK